MKKFKVTINEGGDKRSISVLASCWYDALIIVRPHINENAAARVIVRPA